MSFKCIIYYIFPFIAIPFLLSGQDSSFSEPTNESVSLKSENNPALSDNETTNEEQKVTTEEITKNDEKDNEKAENTGIIVEEDDEKFIIDEEEESLIVEEEDNIITEEEPLPSEDKMSPAKTVVTDKDSVPTEKSIGVQKKSTSVSKETEAAKEVTEKKPEIMQPAKIEKTQSIDFAKNLKEYRSPKKAMFLSLLLPGLGQIYSKKYTKAALFGIVEAALIGFAVKNSIDGKNKKEDARDYADKHFNMDRLLEYYNNLKEYLITEYDDEVADSIIDHYILIGESIEDYHKKYQKDLLDDHDSEERQAFDRDIEMRVFVQGWNDAEPYFDPEEGYNYDSSTYYCSYAPVKDKEDSLMWMLFRIEKGDTLFDPIYGYSKFQHKYIKIVDKSDNYYRTTKNLILIMIANHIVSAIDAFISARAYNKKLLGKKSVWQHINLDHGIVFTNNGIKSRFGFRVKF